MLALLTLARVSSARSKSIKVITQLEGHMKKAIAASLFALGILGCSDGAPSTSDVAHALSDWVPDCKYVSIGNVKKTNGVPQQDGSYVVQTTFEVQFTAIDANATLAKEFNENLEKFNALKEQDKEDGIGSFKFFADEKKMGLATETTAFDESGQATKGRQLYNLDKACPKGTPMSAKLLGQITLSTPTGQLIDLLGNGGAVPFSNQFEMIKTEQGWQFTN